MLQKNTVETNALGLLIKLPADKTLNDVPFFNKTKYKERNLLHVVKSLNYFDDINIQDWPEMISEQNLSLQKVKENLKKQVFDFSKNL